VKLARLTVLLFIPLLVSVEAQAHRFAPSLLRLFEIGDGNYNVVWKTPAQRTSAVPLLPVFPDNCAGMESEAGALEGTGVVSSWRMSCPGGLLGQSIGVSGLAENQASVLLSLEIGDGYFYQTLLNADQADYLVPAEPSAAQVMREYTWLGAEHIWTGIDHLLFVFGLLLLVGWCRNLVWTITAFTAGHSITLSLVTLGFFEYPVALVEFTIALSIFVLAVELARKDGLFHRYPWTLAGGFGLLHGMGFAGALAEVGLPQSELPLALLFFNIGIELGQLAFIAVIMLLWFSVRGLVQGWQGRLQPVPVYVLGSLSAMWCIERALEVI
jgi:hydrogenase/urease accessory protein HupE